jgi:hypothetical protein
MSHLPSIPYDRWAPLSVAEVVERFTGAPFAWGLAGGYAVERFVGRRAKSGSAGATSACAARAAT